MPHCPSYQELDEIIEKCKAVTWPNQVDVQPELLQAICQDAKQMRAYIAKLKEENAEAVKLLKHAEQWIKADPDDAAMFSKFKDIEAFIVKVSK